MAAAAASCTALAAASAAQADGGALTWAPPQLTSPITVSVSNANHALVLNTSRDYIVQMPSQPLTASGGLVISGGHNVVLIGGEISIPYQGPSPAENARRALYLKGQTGVVHVEGLLMDGADIAEGIDLDQRLGATVQIENVRIDNIHARDEVSFSDTHPDLIQTWAGPRILYVDHLTGSTDYQGFFLNPAKYGPLPAGMLFRNFDITGTGTSGYLLWQADPFFQVDQNGSAQPNPNKPWQTFWPSQSWWPNVTLGLSPAGSNVPVGVAGTGYVSPGYLYPAGAWPRN